MRALAGLFARDPDTGAARWFYQWNPHDLYDWDGINENVLLEIDWQGAQQILAAMPERRAIFILPPSRAALESRLRGRNTDSDEVIARRLRASIEIACSCAIARQIASPRPRRPTPFVV